MVRNEVLHPKRLMFLSAFRQNLLVNLSNRSLHEYSFLVEDDINFDDNTSSLMFSSLSIASYQYDFANNFLRKLPDLPNHSEFKVTELLASNNSIDELTIDNLNDHLIVLDMRNNKLRFLSDAIVGKLSGIQKVFLGGNPWHCDCSTVEFFSAIKLNKGSIADYDDVYCENLGKKFSDLKQYEVCFETIYIVAIGGLFFGIIGTVLALFFKYKKDIKIFLYAHNMCLWFVSEDELDEDKVYDAFFCFAAADQHMVEDIIIELESEPNSFKCLVGIRDWPPGRMFAELVSLLSFVLINFNNFLIQDLKLNRTISPNDRFCFHQLPNFVLVSS